MRRDVFQAIADPTRREIINLLANKKMNVTSVNKYFDISQPAISKHLKILGECGLITVEKQGRERYCVIEYEPLAEVASWIEPLRKQWEDRFIQLDQVLGKLKKSEKNEN